MSDRSDFRSATRHWQSLHEQGEYSVEPKYGFTAVMYSLRTEFTDPHCTPERQLAYFEREAHVISRNVKEQGGKSKIFRGITEVALEEVLGDASISSVVTIGNGSLSYIWGNLVGSTSLESFDWHEIANLTTHLKLGSFVQRMCGLFDYDLPVPMGTFVMADHRDVIAPVGKSFSPENYGPTEEFKLRSVCEVPQLLYSDVRYLFPRSDEHDTAEPSVAPILSGSPVVIDSSKKD